ncbi:alpha/beta hydrolase [Nonomuraea sp. NPDC048826]|uniref:alpha/beta hydrolase n=1 Tax=Nonomuraea sp. NPDC048826 TaxID=3364347 RepID=UPI003722EA4D
MMRRIAGSVALVLALTACGGTAGSTVGAAPQASTPTPTPTPTPTKTKAKGPNVSGCYTRDDGEIFTYGDDDLPGVITGDGETGVVISYENNGNVCTWRPLSDRLVAAGYKVLLYARKFDARPEDAALAMARRLAKKGPERVFFVGGSIGATTAVPAATKFGDRTAGVIALSGAVDAGDAAELTVPLLQVGSQNDTYGGADDLNAAHNAATLAPDRQIHVIAGESLHASELFRSPYSDEVIDRILAFMERHRG